jgi:hypothetical protein
MVDAGPGLSSWVAHSSSIGDFAEKVKAAERPFASGGVSIAIA